jgi:hypothetical protein
MNPRRPVSAAVLAAALLTVSTACGGGTTTPPAAAPTGPAAPAASSVETACTNLLAIDSVQSPDAGPDAAPPPEAVMAYGAELRPLLAAATEAAPADLSPSLAALEPVVEAAATEGVPPNFEDPAFNAAVLGYETWAHDNCGYQNIDLVGTDFEFTGAPASLDAGPVSLLLTNESTDDQFHVALFARPNDPAMTVEQFTALSFEELFSQVELVPGGAAAAPGQSGGMLADLEPGKYFLLCPVGEEGEIPHHVQGMITEVTVA